MNRLRGETTNSTTRPPPKHAADTLFRNNVLHENTQFPNPFARPTVCLSAKSAATNGRKNAMPIILLLPILETVAAVAAATLAAKAASDLYDRVVKK